MMRSFINEKEFETQKKSFVIFEHTILEMVEVFTNLLEVNRVFFKL